MVVMVVMSGVVMPRMGRIKLLLTWVVKGNPAVMITTSALVGVGLSM
jgi:hypothetical protein